MIGASKCLVMWLVPYLLGVRIAAANTFLLGLLLKRGKYLHGNQESGHFERKQKRPEGIPSNIVNEVGHTSLTGC